MDPTTTIILIIVTAILLQIGVCVAVYFVMYFMHKTNKMVHAASASRTVAVADPSTLPPTTSLSEPEQFAPGTTLVLGINQPCAAGGSV